MDSNQTFRVSKFAVGTSIVLLLIAMLLPVCHMHPLLGTTAPDHCTICVSLHAALPVGVHAPRIAAPLLSAERIIVSIVQTQSSFTPRFAASRAPPLPAC
jgi:hypothetical protein